MTKIGSTDGGYGTIGYHTPVANRTENSYFSGQVLAAISDQP